MLGTQSDVYIHLLILLEISHFLRLEKEVVPCSQPPSSSWSLSALLNTTQIRSPNLLLGQMLTSQISLPKVSQTRHMGGPKPKKDWLALGAQVSLRA